MASRRQEQSLANQSVLFEDTMPSKPFLQAKMLMMVSKTNQCANRLME
jgi:hypothetical protein